MAEAVRQLYGAHVVGTHNRMILTRWVAPVRHVDHRRMDYSTAKDHNMPIGSGAIESAIRRVINLRVKGNAIYWLRENAETMIRIRASIKSGRAEELFQQTTYVTPKLAL